jgi:hypothetical protein
MNPAEDLQLVQGKIDQLRQKRTVSRLTESEDKQLIELLQMK